jgi:hypothetical protein
MKVHTPSSWSILLNDGTPGTVLTASCLTALSSDGYLWSCRVGPGLYLLSISWAADELTWSANRKLKQSLIPIPVPLCPPRFLHGLAWKWGQVFVVLVSIVARLWASRSGGWVPAGARDYSLPQKRQLWHLPSYLLSGYWRYFLGLKRLGCNVDHS